MKKQSLRDLIWNNKFQTQQTLKYEKGNNSIHPATGNSDRVYKRKPFDDCETTLYFSYLGDGTKEIFPQKIEKVDMYIYNQNNVFVQKTVLNRKELNRQRGTTLNLPSGQYHIICWGNSLNDTRINEGSSLQNNLVGAPHYFTKELISTNDSLYFGEREITIVNESYKVDTVYFSSAHIKMQIELEGLDVGSTRAATSPVSIEMGKLNSTVDFTKTFSNERVSYFPLVTFDSNVQKFGSNSTYYDLMMIMKYICDCATFRAMKNYTPCN